MNPSPYTLLPSTYSNPINTKLTAFTNNFHRANIHNRYNNNNYYYYNLKTPLYPPISPPPTTGIVSHNNNDPSLFLLPISAYKYRHNHSTQRKPYGVISLIQQQGTKFDDNDDAYGGLDDSDDGNDTSTERGGSDEDGITIVETDSSGLPDDMIRELEENQPSEWMIMKDLLGINIFTYILAGLIVLNLSLNLILGPGWLGQQMGLPNTGTFTEISDSLPDVVDLSAPENLL